MPISALLARMRKFISGREDDEQQEIVRGFEHGIARAADANERS